MDAVGGDLGERERKGAFGWERGSKFPNKNSGFADYAPRLLCDPELANQRPRLAAPQGWG